VGAICQSPYNMGIDEVRGSQTTAMLLIAHELGHNANMDHDGSGNSCPDSGYIMAPYTHTSLDVTWSSCSAADVNTYASGGGFNCLSSTPPTVVWNPVCGDGFVSATETCDPGPSGDGDPCCDPVTCQLAAGATCSPVQDECCDTATCTMPASAVCSPSTDPCCTETCTYVPFQTNGVGNQLCRAAVSECDSPEYCHGDSGQCPDDVFLRNGRTCTTEYWGTSGKCFDGNCMNGDQACYEGFQGYAGAC
jgi:hypothetical protein